MNVATVFTIIAGALCVAGFVLLAWMMIAAHLWPRCVLSLESPDESKAAAYATLIVIVIASGVFGYYGAAGLLWMIPESWGGVNDDGVWMSVRNYIAGSAAIVFSVRSEEHTSELQSLMRTSYAVFCMKTKRTSKQSTATPRPTSLSHT